MSSPIRTIRRILVALDASPSSLSALEAAARLASDLQAELEGLFVEDEALLRCADLPFTRVVGSFSGAVQPVGRRDLEQQLRGRAARAQHALEVVAGRARLRWSFRTVRGGVASQLLAASTEADLISLGRHGWSGAGKPRMGATAQIVLRQASAPVLFLDPDFQRGRAVVAVYAGNESSAAGLHLACQLARGGQPLIVALLDGAPDGLKDAATRLLAETAPNIAARYLSLGREPLAELERVDRREGVGILVLPKPVVLEGRLPGILEERRWPALVVG